MTVGIVGLGLIGGSLAKAYTEAGHRVLGEDRDEKILGFAMLSGAVEAALTPQNLEQCQLILIALYPRAAIEWLEQHKDRIAKQTLVMDCCGTKRQVCAACFPMAEASGFTFVGGHPMAGKHQSGFKYSRASLFRDASMVIVPPADDIDLLDRVKQALAPLGLGRLTVTTAEIHDRMIAFTSQMAHVVSNAFIKSPTAKAHKGFSAGSYKDFTRVAQLNAEMWTELFLENRDNLTRELDTLIDALSAYRGALQANDASALQALLEEGSQCKLEVDGR
ncbi:MAG: prephenate dehydrogenase [Firmicutes bacterium]|nr:prephenate dehydrogenase [Bacillota bacterium]